MSKVNTVVMDITPDVAKAYLSKNTKNRPISDRTVKKYAILMRQGKWNFNGETVIISEEDTILDGQHRLNAIISSGTTQRMVVVKGVPADAFTTIDIGKKRNAADALSTHRRGYTQNRMILAPAAQTCMNFNARGVWSSRRDDAPTHGDIINYVEKNPDLLLSVDYVSSLTGAKKLVPKSCLAACHYMFNKKDSDLCDRFFSQLNSGENLKKGDPVLALRNRLIEARHSGGVFRTEDVIRFLIRTWEYLRKGQQTERIVIKSDYEPKVI